MPHSNFFVITGGPGSGKSSLLNELKKRGYRCVDEVARHVIQEQMLINGDALPWKNLKLFKEALLLRSIEDYKAAMESPQEITFFDRDLLDLIAYDRFSNIESSSALKNAVQTFLYNKKVFVAPPWKKIYRTDTERKQTYEEALELYSNLVAVYLEYGREIIELPKTSVAARADFVIHHVFS